MKRDTLPISIFLLAAWAAGRSRGGPWAGREAGRGWIAGRVTGAPGGDDDDNHENSDPKSNDYDDDSKGARFSHAPKDNVRSFGPSQFDIHWKRLRCHYFASFSDACLACKIYAAV